MENVFKESGLSLEQLTEVTKDTIYGICEKLDLKDIVRKVRAKHPEINDKQWGLIVCNEDDLPNLQDGAVVDQILEELDFAKMVEACYSGVPDEESEKEE